MMRRYYDYTGYGGSSGDGSSADHHMDMCCVVKYAMETMHWPKEKIVLLGQSIGTG